MLDAKEAREGFEQARVLRAAGSEQGLDFIAWRDGELWFGQNLIACGEGRVELGMPVEVLA